MDFEATIRAAQAYFGRDNMLAGVFSQWCADDDEKHIFHDQIMGAVTRVIGAFYPEWKSRVPQLIYLYNGANQGTEYVITALVQLGDDFIEVPLTINQIQRIVTNITILARFHIGQSFFLKDGDWTLL